MSIETYRRYTKWLESLPHAIESGEHRDPGSDCVQTVYRIGDVEFLVGDTGFETSGSKIATLPCGHLLKARIFEPLQSPKQ